MGLGGGGGQGTPAPMDLRPSIDSEELKKTKTVILRPVPDRGTDTCDRDRRALQQFALNAR